MPHLKPRSLAAVAAVTALAAGGVAPVALARHGADDPVTHDRGDDRGGQRVKSTIARHGADDPAGHDRFDDRGGRRIKSRGARHGADDRPRHVRHGADDGPNHR
jgi:hypothetical protein